MNNSIQELANIALDCIMAYLRDFNLSAERIPHFRIFTNNIYSMIVGARPFILDLSMVILQHFQGYENPRITFSSFNNTIINVEDRPINVVTGQTSLNHNNRHHHHHHHHHHHTTATDNSLNNFREVAREILRVRQNNSGNNAINRNNDNNTRENSTEGIERQEARALFTALLKYIPFVLLLALKGLYDHKTSILNLLVVLFTFHAANTVVKREIAKEHNKSWKSLLFIICYIIACIGFLNFEYDIHIFSPRTQPHTVWDLLWLLLIIDFILKLITIICKAFLTCLPPMILAYQKRGKYFLMVEATSQLYRSVAPIQYWLYYFFGQYEGSGQIVGIFFSVLYMTAKENDLLPHVKLFHSAACKLFQDVNIGVSPSKEELTAAGENCAICHEKYSIPVRLHCKHIFCENCVSRWLDRERSCPLCRATITDDPIYRDGHTSPFIQLY